MFVVGVEELVDTEEDDCVDKGVDIFDVFLSCVFLDFVFEGEEVEGVLSEDDDDDFLASVLSMVDEVGGLFLEEKAGGTDAGTRVTIVQITLLG